MTSEQLRNSLLQEAISGRLVPQDPNDEPASILVEQEPTNPENSQPTLSGRYRVDSRKSNPPINTFFNVIV